METPRSPWLALESSTSTGSVAVGDAEGVQAEVLLNIAGAHSSALLPAVDRVMQAAGFGPGDLGAVIVGAGPGSFTGVRIAAATAKGLVHGLAVPLYRYSSLLAAAVAGWASGSAVCALFDARKRDVFVGCWQFHGAGDEEDPGEEKEPQARWAEVQRGRASGSGSLPARTAAIRTILQPSAMALDEVIQRFRAGPLPIFVGDGAVLHRDELVTELGAEILPAALGPPRASALLWLASIDPAGGRIERPGGWEPEYIREPGAVRIAAEQEGARAVHLREPSGRPRGPEQSG